MRHEWFSEDMGRLCGGWSGKKPIPMLSRLETLEHEGFEIFSIIPYQNEFETVQVIYRKEYK